MKNIYIIEEIGVTEKMNSIIDSLEVLSSFAEESDLHYIHLSIKELKKDISQISNMATSIDKEEINNKDKAASFVYEFINLSKESQSELLNTIYLLDGIKKH